MNMLAGTEHGSVDASVGEDYGACSCGDGQQASQVIHPKIMTFPCHRNSPSKHEFKTNVLSDILPSEHS